MRFNSLGRFGLIFTAAVAACGPLPQGDREMVVAPPTIQGQPNNGLSPRPYPTGSYYGTRIAYPAKTPTPPRVSAAPASRPPASAAPASAAPAPSLAPGETTPLLPIAYDTRDATTALWAGGEIGPLSDGIAGAASIGRNGWLTGMVIDDSASPATRLVFFDGNSSSLRSLNLDSQAVETHPASGPAIGDTPPAMRLRETAGVVFDVTRNVFYVADRGNHRILSMTPAGEFTVLAGSGASTPYRDSADGLPTFNKPTGLALVGNTLLVTDSGNHSVRAINLANGNVTTLAGGKGVAGTATLTAAAGADARFNEPVGIAVRSNPNVALVADSMNHCIRAIDLTNNQVSVYAGRPATIGSQDGDFGVATFMTPTALATDAIGNLFVGEFGTVGHRLRKVTTTKRTLTVAGQASAGTSVGVKNVASFQNLTGLCVAMNNDGSAKFVYAYDIGPPNTATGQPGPRIVRIQLL